MKIVYYLEVISSWCHWAEPAWTELRKRYEEKAEMTWKVALMEASAFPQSRAQADWFYRRSGTIVRSPYMLNSGWYEDGRTEYLAPNMVAEAARDFGVTDDRVRLAISHAAVREGQRVGDWETSARIAAAAMPGLLEVDKLLERARSAAIESRVQASTGEFHALGVTQRPTFVLENAWGDRAVLSGLASAVPLLAAADALFADESAQLSYTQHHGQVPPP